MSKESLNEDPVPSQESASPEIPEGVSTQNPEIVKMFTKENSSEIREDVSPEHVCEAAEESIVMQTVEALEKKGGRGKVFKIATAALGALALASIVSPPSAEAHGRRRVSPWKAAGIYAVVRGIDAVLGGGGYTQRYPGRYGYSDPYRYENQLERDVVRAQRDVAVEELRQRGETDREALRKGIVPPAYREQEEELLVNPAQEERRQELEQLGRVGAEFKAGYEAGKAEIEAAFTAGREAGKVEVEAAKRYGSDPSPDLTPGRWEELLRVHNKRLSPHFLKGFRQAWTDNGGEIK